MPSVEIRRSRACAPVVVTGLGVVTPLGLGKGAFWQALLAGQSGVGRITSFDTTDFDVKIAAEVRDFDPSSYMSHRDIKRTDRFTQFAVAASLMALEDAGLEITPVNAPRVGVLIGSGAGGLTTLEAAVMALKERGPSRVSPILVSMMVQDAASGWVSLLTGAQGPNSTVVTACATGAHALGDSLEILRRGHADVMICGGSEAAITPITVASFGNARALTSRYNDDPPRASRPFDRDRDGFVMGEGAGIVILETREHAEKRGAARIYAELAGYGMSGDAFHIMQPSPDGEGVARALRIALADASESPEKVDYISAHAPSTPLGDACETRAYKSVFGAGARKLALSAIKSMTGHLLGASGAIAAVATILAIDQGILPPTINYDNLDPACDLDCVPNTARPATVNIAVANSSGFGGHNAVLVFRRYP